MFKTARELKLELPPFRDSYQTSVFLATRLGLSYSLGNLNSNDERCKDNDLKTCLRRVFAKFATPRAFEVGRSMLIPLGEKEQKGASWKFRSDLSLILRSIVVGSGALLLFAFLSIQYNRQYARRVVLVAGLTVLIPLFGTVLVYLADGINGEPFPLRGSANILPTLVLLLLGLMLASLFLTNAHTDLHLNARRLLRDFKTGTPEGVAQIPAVA